MWQLAVMAVRIWYRIQWRIHAPRAAAWRSEAGWWLPWPLLLPLLLTLPLTLAAQVPPPASDPARVEQQMRPLPEPRSQPQIPTPEPTRIAPGSEDAQTRLQLNQIELRGNSALPESHFADLWQHHLGQQVSLAEIREIARQITSRYRNAGYILSQALVPPQEVTNGVVVIELLEGFVDAIAGEDGAPLRGTLAAYSAHIPASRPLHIAELERWLLLINDLPGVQAQSILRPSPETPGGAALILRHQQTPYALRSTLTNRAGPYYQDWGVNLAASAHNRLGLDEGLFTRLALAGDGASGDRGGYRNLNLGLALPLGEQGLRLDLTLDHTRSRLGHDLQGVGYQGHANSARIRLSYPFERSRSRSLHGHLGFDLAHSGLDLHQHTVSDDRLRVVRGGVAFDWAGLGGLSLLHLEASAGLDAFGASAAGSPHLSRAEGDAAFFTLAFDLLHRRPLWQDGVLRVDLLGQLADRKLLSAEEISFGGGRIGRGYNSSEISGDRGLGLALELAQKLPYDLHGYAFYDLATVANRSSGGDASLASAGLGLRHRYQRLRSQLELAVPLTRPIAHAKRGEERDWRLFLNLSLDY